MKYHGEVLDSEGREFLIIEGEFDLLPTVSLKANTGAIRQEMDLDPSEARELARHLIAAADAAEVR